MPRSPALSSDTRLPSLTSATISPDAASVVVAEELGGAELLLQLEPEVSVAASPEPVQDFRASARWRSIAASKPLRVDADAAGLQRVLGQVVGEAVGVVELERGLAGKRVAALQASRSPRRAARSPRSSVSRKRVSSSFSVSSISALAAHELGVGVRPSRRPAPAPAATSAAPRRRADARGAWRGA